MSKMANLRHFSVSESKELVKIFCSEAVQVKLTTNKKSHDAVWDDVSSELLNRDPNWIRSAKQCKDKIKNLKKDFYMKKRLHTGSGAEDWPYFADFSKLFGGTAICDPVLIVDSLDKSGV
jgi:Myb/SANT-like DNA-binding domain